MIMEAFSEVIKVLFEKRFIPTIIGIVVGILAYALTPETNILLEKLGRNWYVILFAGLAIIFVSFLQFLLVKIPAWNNANKSNHRSKMLDLKEEKQGLQTLWDFIDKLPVEERQLINTFLENGNKPVVVDNCYRMVCLDFSLFDEPQLLKMRTIKDENGYPIKQYVLDETFYNNLLYSKQKYGRISNFKED